MKSIDQGRKVEVNVIVWLHHKLSLRTILLYPLQQHHRLNGQVVVWIYETLLNYIFIDPTFFNNLWLQKVIQVYSLNNNLFNYINSLYKMPITRRYKLQLLYNVYNPLTSVGWYPIAPVVNTVFKRHSFCSNIVQYLNGLTIFQYLFNFLLQLSDCSSEQKSAFSHIPTISPRTKTSTQYKGVNMV